MAACGAGTTADQMRRVGGLMAYGETDPEAEALHAEFTRGLSELGSTDGRNLRLDVRWAPGNTRQPDVRIALITEVCWRMNK